MICDIHVHLAASSVAHSGNYVSPRLANNWILRVMARRFEIKDVSRPDFNDLATQKTLRWLDQSKVDQAVLLAFDAAYSRNGQRDLKKTLLITDNDFVADLADGHRKALFGASVHPCRPGALVEMERLIGRGACLVKWLPGAQNIQPDDPCCFPFYELLAHHKIPLLCHTGSEHTLKNFPNSFNDPRRLIPALQRGVTVIAAHCGTRLLLHEKNYFKSWCELAMEHELFFGDISAFGVITRVRPLQTMLQNPALASKLAFGSDFPAWTMPLSFAGQANLGRLLKLRRVKNPFDQTVETMKTAGVSDDIFARGATLLRIPEKKRNPRT